MELNKEGPTRCPECGAETGIMYTVDDDPKDPNRFVLKSFKCNMCGFEEYFNQEA